MTTTAPVSKRDEFRALLPEDKRDAFDDFVDVMESEIEDQKDTLDGWDAEHADDHAELESALMTVRYWLHDGLFLKKPIKPPQRILRVVERALGVG